MSFEYPGLFLSLSTGHLSDGEARHGISPRQDATNAKLPRGIFLTRIRCSVCDAVRFTEGCCNVCRGASS